MDYYSPVMKQSLQRYFDRSRKSVGDWLRAWIVADARIYPRRKELIDMYDYIMLDNHTKAVVRNRRNQVIGEKWDIVDADGVTLDETKKAINKTWFKKFLRMAHDARPYGFSLLELHNTIGGEVYDVVLIDRRNVSPERKEVLIRPTDLYGISIMQPAFYNNYVFVDGQEDLGYLLSLAPDVIYKRYAKAAWTEHAETFALPFIHAKTNMGATDANEALREELRNAGRERVLLTNHGDEINPVTLSSGDAHKIYDELIERANSEISKLVLGQTMTTDDGSSRSQSEVHERVGDQIAKDDREWLVDIVNDELFPRLRGMGYQIPEDAVFGYNLTKEATTDEKVKVFTMLLDHYDIQPGVIKESFGVDVEKKEVPATLAAAGVGGKKYPTTQPVDDNAPGE